jgi:hypothetical protein
MLQFSGIVGLLSGATGGLTTAIQGGTTMQVLEAQAKWFALGFGAAITAYGSVWATSAAVTYFLGHATTVSSIVFTGTTAERQLDPSRQVPNTILQAAIQFGERLPDPQGAPGAYKFVTEMFKDGKPYQLEVVAQEVSPGVYRILHFLYD